MQQLSFAPVTGTAASQLRRTFAGPVHEPGDAAYDVHRKALVPTLDPRPLVVAEASGPSDVRAAVLAARDHDLPLAVQATGHGTRVPSDGGVLLKTTAMTGVLVDPQRRIAKVGPGTRWGAVIDAAQPFGLAPLAGSSRDVGVTGYTLGGGVGWLGRKHGLAADSVLRADVVTADGRLVTATPDRNPELFWALRGGAGNFGIVTSLEFRLYPVARVHSGIAYFPIERAADTLARYRRWAAEAPDEMSTAVLLTRSPQGERSLAIKITYAGEPADAERLIQPLRSTAGPELHSTIRTSTFAESAMGGTPAKYLDLVDDLSDDLIQTLTTLDGEPTVEIRHWGGAMANGTGPAGHRTAPFSLIVDQDVAEPLRPHHTGRTFLNFLADPTKAETAFTPENYQRLREVKTAYDPDNFFHLNHNIASAGR